jgi:hypothetical protein
MGLRDILSKKDRESREAEANRLAAPEFTFIRSDTTTEEVIYPPGTTAAAAAAGGSHSDAQHLSAAGTEDASRPPRRSLDVFRSSRSRSASVSSQASTTTSAKKESSAKRLSQRLHLSRETTSENVPENLPEIAVGGVRVGGSSGSGGSGGGIPADEDKESEWEKRATILASQNERVRSRPASPVPVDHVGMGALDLGAPRSGRHVSSAKTDEDIQEAIRLHEEGDLAKSTELFGRLADPRGANNPLSQVLYGLALR